MQNKIKYSVLVFTLIMFSITGCATVGSPPMHSDIKKSEVLDYPYDAVWGALISSIAEMNLPISTLEKASGIIVLSNMTYDGDVANEGERGSILGIKDVIVERKLDFNIVVATQGLTKTSILINSNFNMRIRRGNGSELFPFTYSWERAYSNGKLERSLINNINTKLKKH